MARTVGSDARRARRQRDHGEYEIPGIIGAAVAGALDHEEQLDGIAQPTAALGDLDRVGAREGLDHMREQRDIHVPRLQDGQCPRRADVVRPADVTASADDEGLLREHDFRDALHGAEVG